MNVVWHTTNLVQEDVHLLLLQPKPFSIFDGYAKLLAQLLL